MREILILLATAATTLILGIILMSQELFSDGALLILLAIILSALANTEYKYDKPKDKKWGYIIYALAATYGVWALQPARSEALLKTPLIIIYGALALYLYTQALRAWRNKQ